MASPAKATPTKATPAKPAGRPGRGGLCFFCEESTPSVQSRSAMQIAQWRPRAQFFECHLREEGKDLYINSCFFSSLREQTCALCATTPLLDLEGTAHLQLVKDKMMARRRKKGLTTPPQQEAREHNVGQPTMAVAADDLQAIADEAIALLEPDGMLTTDEAIDLYETPPEKVAPLSGGERATSEQSRLLPPRSLFEHVSSSATSLSTTTATPPSAATATPPLTVTATATATATAAVASALFANTASSLVPPKIVEPAAAALPDE